MFWISKITEEFIQMKVTQVDSLQAFSVLSNRVGRSGRSYRQLKNDYHENTSRTPESVRSYTDSLQRNNEQLFGILAADMFALQKRIECLETRSPNSVAVPVL